MIGFYVRKIKNQDINKKTGKAWSVEDVSYLWREEVEAVLKRN